MEKITREQFLAAMKELDAWPQAESGWSNKQIWTTEEGKPCGVTIISEERYGEKDYFII